MKKNIPLLVLTLVAFLPATSLGYSTPLYPKDAFPKGTQCEYKAKVARAFRQALNEGTSKDDLYNQIKYGVFQGNLTKQEGETGLYILKTSWGATPVESAKNALAWCQKGKL